MRCMPPWRPTAVSCRLHTSLRLSRCKHPALCSCCLCLQFTDSELHAFLEAYRGEVDSVHEDTEVSVFEVEDPAPWGLDRLDQRSLPLNQDYDYYNLGTGVNVYIVDTVRCSGEDCCTSVDPGSWPADPEPI